MTFIGQYFTINCIVSSKMELETHLNVTGLVRFIIPLTAQCPKECGSGIASINAKYSTHVLLLGRCSLHV